MNLIDAYNSCEVNERIAHENPITHALTFITKTSTDELRTIIGKGVQQSQLTDEQLTDDNWSLEKSDAFVYNTILKSIVYNGTPTSDGTITSFTITALVELANAAYDQYIIDTTNTDTTRAAIKEIKLTYYKN